MYDCDLVDQSNDDTANHHLILVILTKKIELLCVVYAYLYWDM